MRTCRPLLVLLTFVVAAGALAAVPARAAPGDHRNGPIKLTVTGWNPATTDLSLDWRPFNNGVHYMLEIGHVGATGPYGALGLGDYATSWRGLLSGPFGALSPGEYFVQVVGCRDDPEVNDAWQCWFSNRIELTVGG